jgi:DNA-binding transcriptional regulator YdaS (Cro superfamily)
MAVHSLTVKQMISRIRQVFPDDEAAIESPD